MTPSTFMIRPAVLDDALEIAEIHYLGWKSAYAGVVDDAQIEAKRPDRRLDYWKHKMADGQNLVLVGMQEEDGPILGFIYGGPVLEHDITREIPGAPKLEDFDCEINIVHCRHARAGQGPRPRADRRDRAPLAGRREESAHALGLPQQRLSPALRQARRPGLRHGHG